MSNLNWHGDALLRDMLNAADAGVGQAAEVVVTQAKINLSRPGMSKQARKGAKLVRAAERKGNTAQELFRLIGRNKQTGRLKSNSGRGVQIREALSLRRFGTVDPAGGFPRLRTGFLRRSIKSGHVGVPVKGERWVGSTMDPVTGYAAAQEFGSPKLNLPARPYIRPAFDATGAAQTEAFVRAAKAILEAQTKP
jgi:hypothetical protein